MTAQTVDGRRVSAPRFIGRTTELATLARTLATPSAVAVVEGEAGVGKTRLVAELLDHPALAGQRLVRGNCRRIREPFPLGPLVEALRDTAGDLPTGQLSPVVGALRPLLPELSAVLPPAPEPLDDRAAERHRVVRAVAEVLAALAPAILVIEDLHWADEHTLDFLGYLRTDPPPGLSLLLTFRSEETPTTVRAAAGGGGSADAATGAHATLPPLDAAETGALAAAILGQDRVSDELAAYLCERASGLPFIVEELLALMRVRGVLARRDGAWVRRAISQLDVPAGVRDPVRERLSRLGADARAVVEAAAVLQTPCADDLLLTVTGLPSARGRPGLEEALESGLLTEAGGDTGFRHVLAAQAVYEGIIGPRRQRLHARAADTLGGLDAVPLGQHAHHLQQAGRVREWVEAAEQAADRARGLGHDDEAARLLEEVLTAPLEPVRRGRIAVKLATAAHRMLHFDKNVVRLLDDVPADELPPSLRGELMLRVALLLERAGEDLSRQRRLLAAAVEHLTDRPELRAHAMAGLAIPSQPGVPLAEHQRWLDRVLDTVPSVREPALRVSLLGKVAMVRVAVGDPRWRELTDRICAMTGGMPSHPAELTAFHSIGASACYAGHLTVADELLTALSAATTGEDDHWRELSAGATRTLLDYCRGEWEGLDTRAAALADQLADHAPGRADVEVVTSFLGLARGDHVTGSGEPFEVARRLAAQGAYDILPLAVAAAVRSAVGRDDPADARDRAQELRTVMESVPLVASAAWALPPLTEALVHAGAVDDARRLVTRWSRRLPGPGAPLMRAAVPQSRGTLRAAAGDWTAAARDFRTAAGRYQQAGCAYEAVRAREQAGAGSLRAADRDRGAGELAAALAAYRDLGAAWDLDRCSRTARAYGVPVPGRHRGGRHGYGDELSPREREVADLAAQGRRNREIAAALYLSTSTVNKHLTAAMRKLDVTSRAGLARRLLPGGE